MIGFLQACFLDNSVKLQIILQTNKKWIHLMIITPDSHPGEGSTYILAPT